MPSITDHLRLLQFGDSLFPIGSFSFSNGLESAIQVGIVHDVSTLEQYVLTAVTNAATSDGVALLVAHRAVGASDMQLVLAADREVFLRKLNEEMRTMTTRMGRKLAEVADSTFHDLRIADWIERIKRRETPGTLPVAQGVLFSALGLPEDQAFAAHQYGVASMMLGAALRLMKLNYLDGQAVLFRVNGAAEELYARVVDSTLEDMAVFAPTLDILASVHVRSHVRMFMN
jgi:urease accessory protein